jgi:hypothetical protein
MLSRANFVGVIKMFRSIIQAVLGGENESVVEGQLGELFSVGGACEFGARLDTEASVSSGASDGEQEAGVESRVDIKAGTTVVQCNPARTRIDGPAGTSVEHKTTFTVQVGKVGLHAERHIDGSELEAELRVAVVQAKAEAEVKVCGLNSKDEKVCREGTASATLNLGNASISDKGTKIGLFDGEVAINRGKGSVDMPTKAVELPGMKN